MDLEQKEPEQQEYTTDPIIFFFEYAHLPPELQEISKLYCGLARHVMFTLPANFERNVALRKLLESKDAAVRTKHLGGPKKGWPCSSET